MADSTPLVLLFASVFLAGCLLPPAVQESASPSPTASPSSVATPMPGMNDRLTAAEQTESLLADASARVSEANELLVEMQADGRICRSSAEFKEAQARLREGLVGYKKAELRLEFLQDVSGNESVNASLREVGSKYLGTLAAAEVLENRAEDC